MKPSKEEKLFEHLSRIDDTLLTESFETDDPKKLLQYKKRYIPFYRRPGLIAGIAAAACAALLIGVLWPKTQVNPSPIEPPISVQKPIKPVAQLPVPQLPTVETGEFSITSGDMLNYYGGMYLLTEHGNSVSFSTSGSTYTLQLLNSTDATESPLPPDVTEGPPLSPPQTDPPQDSLDPEIYYYEFDRNGRFFISQAIYAQIALTNPDGFLASKIGCGTVDVMITNSSIEPMITFKNGDRYFSCLLNGGGYLSEMEFSTHKYVEGLYIVKNFELSENYSFMVCFDENQNITHIECQVFGIGDRPDGIMPVVSQTLAIEVNASFTIDQLEEYYNTTLKT